LFSVFSLGFSHQIIEGSVEKNDSLNLFYYILNFGYVLITYSKSLDFGVISLLDFGTALILNFLGKES